MCLADAAGGEGEVRGESLASLEGPLKRLSTLERGVAEGDDGEAALPETSDTEGKEKAVSSSSLTNSQNGACLRAWNVGTRGIVGEGVRGGEVKAGGISSSNSIVPSSSSLTNISSMSARLSSSRTIQSLDRETRAGS